MRVDERDFQGCTPLHYAAKNGQVEVVRELLRSGADPSACDQDTESVLMWASAAGQTEVVRLILDAGADVNAITDLDGTALRWAAKHGHLETVKVLLEAGANPNAPGVLTYAEYGNHDAVAKLIEAAQSKGC